MLVILISFQIKSLSLCVCVLVAQSFPILCNPIDCSLPASSVHGILHPWGFSPEARRGSQGASRAAPGKSGLHARGEGERVLALESREGTR